MPKWYALWRRIIRRLPDSAPGPVPGILTTGDGHGTKGGTMKGRMPPFPLPFRHPLAALLGLAAVIVGILGMHMLSGSHNSPRPDGQALTFAAAADHRHHHLGEQPAAAAADGSEAASQAAGCAGPCGDGHALMDTICILMAVVAGFSVLFFARYLLLTGRHSRRGPPGSFVPARPVFRSPSLVQLCISRT
ncbi:DUF6153 family protein [Arthrobacter sp. GCM10027362]|uniref:DUF6153 family protein n=1 Tax=Arthrobacter sp. GCM10027362 TaxID=3273379 RepID=UPI0036361837